jgi:hypothetical protein
MCFVQTKSVWILFFAMQNVTDISRHVGGIPHAYFGKEDPYMCCSNKIENLQISTSEIASVQRN